MKKNRWYYLVLFGVILGMVSIGKGNLSAGCAQTATGIVSWWPGESTGLDVAGTNAAYLMNGAGFAPGLVGQAFTFDGVNDSVAIPRSPSLDLGNQLTVELWMRADPSNPMTTLQGLISTDFYVIGIFPGRSWVPVGINFGVSTNSNDDFTMTSDTNGGGIPVSPGAWHHIAGTYDGLKLQLYIDGRPAGNPTPMTGRIAPMLPTSFVTLGSEDGRTACGGTCVGQRYFKGLIDEPAIYNRALSAAEIWEIYSAGAAGKCAGSSCISVPNGIVSWWKGDGNGADSAGTNSAFLENGTTFSSGTVGQAFGFDGTNDFVRVPPSPGLNVSNQFTLDFWMRAETNNVIGASYQGLVTSDYYGIEISTSFLRRGIQVYGSTDSGTTFVHTSDFNGGLGAIFPSGEWHHIAGTYNGSALQLYVDGQPYGNPAPLTGLISPMGSQSFLTIGAENGRNFGDRYFNGQIDEVDLFNRALSPTEILGIYRAGAAGKCAIPRIPPVVLTPATSRTVVAGASVTFQVVADGSAPLTYQWAFNGASIQGATNSVLTLTNVKTSQSGTYTVHIINPAGTVDSSAQLTVTLPPASIQVGTRSVTAGMTNLVQVVMVANGNENALGFTLNFTPTQLSFQGIELGVDAVGGTLVVNTSQASIGRVGVILSMPFGATFSAGTQQVAVVRLSSPVLPYSAFTSVGFGDQVITRQLSDAAGNVLPAIFFSGTVSVVPAQFEADVAPRPTGDGKVTVTDWVLVGRFAAKLDEIDPTNATEFQRADCAPRATLGDGVISVTDWVQTGRYAAKLDELTPAGGPTGRRSLASPPVNKLALSRRLSLSGASLLPGERIILPISLEAQGDENALGFSISFNPQAFAYRGITLGGGASAATLQLNTNNAANGKIAVMLGMPTGANLAAGSCELLKLSLQSISAVSGDQQIAFTDDPVVREVSDAYASALGAEYANAVLTVLPLPNLSIQVFDNVVELSWPTSIKEFLLQECGPLATDASAWSAVTAPVALVGDRKVVNVPLGDSRKFFRLQNP